MRAGRLDNRVNVQSPTGSRDAVGERVTSWSNVVTDYPAGIEPLKVAERNIASQQHSSTTHRIMLRYASALSTIDASWRILFGSRIFTIDGVRNINEKNRELELLCTEGLREE